MSRAVILLAVLVSACIDQNWARGKRDPAPGAPQVPSCADGGGIKRPGDGGLLCWDGGGEDDDDEEND